MADTKVTDLVELTTALVTDVLLIIDDPAGTPISKKITLTNLFLAYEGKASTITGVKTFGAAADVGKLAIAVGLAPTNVQLAGNANVCPEPLSNNFTVLLKPIA